MSEYGDVFACSADVGCSAPLRLVEPGTGKLYGMYSYTVYEYSRYQYNLYEYEYLIME